MSRADDQDPTLPPQAEAELLEALEAALRPQPLDPATAERLVALALEDPFAEPTADELAESARLRDALETGAPHEADALVGALRAPFIPASDDSLRLERAWRHAVGGDAASSAEGDEAARPPRRRVLYAWFGAASVALAAAAAVALFVAPVRRAERPASASAVAATPVFLQPRSTADLFAERFETSSTSARMDVIASARSRDLRDNRYAAWGLR